MYRFEGKCQALTPEWTANISADCTHGLTDNLEMRATLDLSYNDEYLTSSSLAPRMQQDAYTKVNARLPLSSIDGDEGLALMGKTLPTNPC